MHSQKKLLFYEVDPVYFFDNKNKKDSIKNIGKQIDYFKELKVNSVILKNLFENDNGKNESYLKVSSTIGSNQEVFDLIKIAKSKNIVLLIEINVGYVRENHIWFQEFIKKSNDYISSFTDEKESKIEQNIDATTEVKYNSITRQFYLMDNLTNESPLNWANEKVQNSFIEILKFWLKKGIDGFVIKNFEYLDDIFHKKPMSKNTHNILRNIKREVTGKFPNALIIGSTGRLKPKEIRIVSKQKDLFDLVISKNLALMNNDPTYEQDLFIEKKPKDLVKLLSQLNSSNLVVGVNESGYGRFLNKWINVNAYHRYGAAAVSMIHLLLQTHTSIYMGEEIGMVNKFYKTISDIPDKKIFSKSRMLVANGKNSSEFLKAKIMNHSSHLQTYFPWKNKEAKGNDLSHINVDQKTNLRDQFTSDNSLFKFNKKLIKLIKSPFYGKMFSSQNVKINIGLNGIIKISGGTISNKFIALINLSEKEKINFNKYKISNNALIYLSTYDFKEYSKIPLKLRAYEGIIVIEDKGGQTNEMIQKQKQG